MASSYGDASPGAKPSPGTFTPESLPSSDPPASASPEQCKVIEENMVAVENKILRGLKSKSNNLWWDGKPETLLAFLQSLEEWVHIRFGEVAMRVLVGQSTRLDGTPIPPFIYTTWSKELYLVILGLLGSGKESEKLTSASAVLASTLDRRAEIKHSAYNLLAYWKSLGQVVTEQDCRAIDAKIKMQRVELDDAAEVIAHKISSARRLWERKPDAFRGSDATLEGIVLGLLPQQCDEWRTHYLLSIDTQESLYCMARPSFDTLVKAVQGAVLRSQLRAQESRAGGTTLLAGDGGGGGGGGDGGGGGGWRGGARKCLNCKSEKHTTRECTKTCTAGPNCNSVFCGFNLCGVCPVKSGIMPERILNSEGRSIPFPLYNRVKADFDRVHNKGKTTPPVQAGAAALLVASDEDDFFNTQRVQGMTMCAWGDNGPALGCEDDFFNGTNVYPDYRDGGCLLPVLDNNSDNSFVDVTKKDSPSLLFVDAPSFVGALNVQGTTFEASDHAYSAPFVPKLGDLLVAIDSGSNRHVTPRTSVLRGSQLLTTTGQLAGANVNAPTSTQGEAVAVPMVFEDIDHKPYTGTLSCVVLATGCPCTLLSQSKMWDDHRWKVQCEDVLRVTCGHSGRVLPIMRHDGLFVVSVCANIESQRMALFDSLGGASLLTQAERSHEALLWSARLGSIDGRNLAATLDANVGHGVKEVTAYQRGVLATCSVRNAGGMLKIHHGEVPASHREAKPGGLFVLDGFGPYHTCSIGTGATYLLGGVDAATGCPFVQQTATHTAAVYLKFFDVCNAETKAAGHEKGILAVRTDNAPELAGTEWVDGLAARGVLCQKTPPYEKGGTSMAERLFGILEPIARKLLVRAQLNDSFFLHAMTHAATILRHMVRKGDTRSRGHNFSGAAEDLSKFKAFGSPGWCRVPPQTRDGKAAPVSDKCAWVGVDSTGWLVVVGRGATAKLVATTQARFYETGLISVGVMSAAAVLDHSTQTDEAEEELTVADVVVSAGPAALAPVPISLTRPRRTPAVPDRFTPTAMLHALQPEGAGDGGVVLVRDLLDDSEALKLLVDGAHERPEYAAALMRGPVPAESYASVVLVAAKPCAPPKVVTLMGPGGAYEEIEPRNMAEARRVPNAQYWMNAEVQHVAELEGDGILRPVDRTEAGDKKIYPSQMEYTLQKNQDDGTLKRRKVRGCLNGKNWDGDATGLYSTGAGRDVVMLQIAVGNAKGHRNLKLDIKNAYPEAKWPEGTKVYMRMFRGHTKYSADGTPMVYDVVHNYWGAPPAGAIFVNWLKVRLVDRVGFTELQSCNAAYRLDIEDRHVNLTTTTDDLLLTGETADLELVLTALKKEVTELKLEWDPTSFAGLELRQCKVRKSITVSVYTKVLEYAHLAGVTKAATANVTKDDWASIFLVPRGDELSATQQLTRRLTGMLAWFADLRLDVKPVAHKLQRVSHSPSEGAYAVHVKLAGLLLVDPHAGITFGGSPAANAQDLEITLSTPVGTEMKITGSATKDFSIVYDSTWMDGHTNQASTWGAAYLYNGAAFATDIHTVPEVSLSSTHAEAYAQSAAQSKGIYFQNILTEFSAAPQLPTRLWGDNSAVVGVTSNTQSPNNLRHVMRRIKFSQEQERSGKFRNLKVHTDHNVVDYFGKCVTYVKARKSAQYLMNTANEVPAK